MGELAVDPSASWLPCIPDAYGRSAWERLPPHAQRAMMEAIRGDLDEWFADRRDHYEAVAEDLTEHSEHTVARTAVAPREPRVLTAADLAGVVESVVTEAGSRTGEADPVSLSARDLTAQECLTLLFSLRAELFPQGVAAARAVDDGAVGLDAQRSRLAPGADWKRVRDWESVTEALRASGPGSAAFVLARRPQGKGHAFAAYVPEPANGEPVEVAWLDPQQAKAGLRVDKEPPHIRPVEARAVVIDRQARIVHDALPDFVVSSSAGHVQADPSASRQYTGGGIEREFLINLVPVSEWPDIFSDDVIAEHVSGSQLRIDGGPEHWLPEFVSRPAAVLEGEEFWRPRDGSTWNSEAAFDLSDAAEEKLLAGRGRTIGDVFSDDGWRPASETMAGLPIPPFKPYDVSALQFTFGVPVDGLLSLLALDRSRNRVAPFHAAAHDFGMSLAHAFVGLPPTQPDPAKAYLLSPDPRVREVWGYGWLLWTHAAAPVFQEYVNRNNIVKNFLAVAARNPLGEILGALREEVQDFLRRNATWIKEYFSYSLHHYLKNVVKVPNAPARAGVLLQADLTASDNGHSVDDYLTYGLTGSTRAGLTIGQREAVGLREKTEFQRLHRHGGVPLALIELRNYGPYGVVMKRDQMRRQFADVAALTQDAFAYSRGRPRQLEDLATLVRSTLSDGNVLSAASLLAFVPVVRDAALPVQLPDSSWNLFLADSLASVARGGRLASAAVAPLGALADFAAQELDRPAAPGNPARQEVLGRAIAAVRGLISASAGPGPAPVHAARGPGAHPASATPTAVASGSHRGGSRYPRPPEDALRTWLSKVPQARGVLARLGPGQLEPLRDKAVGIVGMHHVSAPDDVPGLSQEAEKYRQLHVDMVDIVADELERNGPQAARDTSKRMSEDLGTGRVSHPLQDRGSQSGRPATAARRNTPARSSRPWEWSEPAPGADQGLRVGDGSAFGAATGFAGVTDRSRAMEIARGLIDVPAAVEQPVAARTEAARLVGLLLGDGPVAERVAASGVRVVVIPRSGNLADLPPYAGLEDRVRPPAGVRGWTDQERALVAVSEENLLGRAAADPARTHPEGYSSVLHEAAHLVYAFGLDDALRTRAEEAFGARRDAGPARQWVDGPLWDVHGDASHNHSATDAAEYFAQSTVAYFGANHGLDATTRQRRNNGAAWLADHDPVLYSLLNQLYGPPPALTLHANALSVTDADDRLWETLTWHTGTTAHTTHTAQEVPPAARTAFAEDVRPAVRLWQRPLAEEIAALRDILRTPGSRSLVFGTAPVSPVWAINAGGEIRWLDALGTGDSTGQAPGAAQGQVVSIDLDNYGQLTGPSAKAAESAGARTDFCDLNLGADLLGVLGWRAGRR
ncbi:toxin glutamine deamidase domain-containing protein [Streptomyces sp. NPDC023723]|uniref:toxin glutamine deamidase domain-containing protein n=1 Tax=Streptomyces sp. NPDC023723 TaxID=3154323 RepID=UPI0033E356B9